MAPRATRREVLRALAVAGLATVVSGCAKRFSGTRLTIATGDTQGLYYTLGTALATVWQERLKLDHTPVALQTAGSVANLELLVGGEADLAFSQVDAAADQMARHQQDAQAFTALARIYDELVHVVVRASSPITSLDGLRGARVSVGARDSGVLLVARRLLDVAGLDLERDLDAVQLGINESVSALLADEIDAFFWCGGLPTTGVSELTRAVPIRLLDLEDLVGPIRARHPVYAPGLVPANTYGTHDAVTTVLVRNFLLTRPSLPNDLARALLEAMFDARFELAQASPAALTISPRVAIGTQPVPLHPGAEDFYRSAKDV